MPNTLILSKDEIDLRDGETNQDYYYEGEVDKKQRASGIGVATLVKQVHEDDKTSGTWLENKKHGLCKFLVVCDLF